MSLQSYIEKMRAKPEHVRRRAAFYYALGITGVIFSFWLASWTTIGDTAKGTITDAVDRAGTPAQSLVANVGSFFGDVKDIIFGPKKIQYSSVEISAGSR